jgi:putative GTP pyrophosphokinase
MNDALAQTYAARYRSVLAPAAKRLQGLISSHLKGRLHIDRVTVRAKDLKSFLGKAKKRKNGKLRYVDPLGQIQDQIGARVIVFYTSDVKPTSTRLLRYFKHIERSNKEPKSSAEFGYFGKHFILALPDEVIPATVSLRRAPKVFELQIRTLFQHAWSEAEHDLGYKPKRKLTKVEKRKFALTAAHAWGADRIFQELHQSLKR